MTLANLEQTASPARRVLLYTHNSIGLGHVFRSLAVITGMRPWAPHWDYLVVSGSSIPQAFLAEGIEVLKLPGVRKDLAGEGAYLRPRHLMSMTIDRVFELRSRLIADAFACFAPDIVLVEHNMAGLMNELVPVLREKRLRRGGARDFALAHLSRGIMSAYPRIQLPQDGPPQLSGPVKLEDLYDFVYILEDRQVATGHDGAGGASPDLAGRATFLGKIGIKNRAELPPANQVKRAWGLTDAPLILLSLGRIGLVAGLTQALGQALGTAGLLPGHQVAVVLDPYLPPTEREALEKCAAELDAKVLGFNPYLVELINAADLVVCRAGYNTFNEALLSGTRALFVPECHGGMEQERRVMGLTGPHQMAVSEAEVLSGEMAAKLPRLMSAPRDPDPPALDRFAVGRRIAHDLEQWLGQRSTTGREERDGCRA